MKDSGAQQARASGNRLVTGPDTPETFKEAKRQDNIAIMGLPLILGTTASSLWTVSSSHAL